MPLKSDIEVGDSSPSLKSATQVGHALGMVDVCGEGADVPVAGALRCNLWAVQTSCTRRRSAGPMTMRQPFMAAATAEVVAVALTLVGCGRPGAADKPASPAPEKSASFASSASSVKVAAVLLLAPEDLRTLSSGLATQRAR